MSLKNNTHSHCVKIENHQHQREAPMRRTPTKRQHQGKTYITRQKEDNFELQPFNSKLKNPNNKP